MLYSVDRDRRGIRSPTSTHGKRLERATFAIKGDALRAWRTWLRPGMLVKRWFGLFMLGAVLTGLALAMAVAYAYRYVAFPSSVSGIVQAITLQFLPRPVRFALVLALGIVFLAVGFWRLSHSLVSPLLARSALGTDLAQVLAEHRFGPNRPAMNVVAIGGGTGLSTLLRGLKHHDIGITAIVTVSDDGGSTGRIRSEFNMPAPGDIRSCLVALAGAESTVGRLFQYRFDQQGSDLTGHSFGNLFITALTQVTGSFEQAVIESANVLAVRGRVLPSTLDNVTLGAELVDGSVVRGESTISHNKPPIRRVFLEPRQPEGYGPAMTAILNADLIILGPGSLYTSVLPNLLVEGISQTIRWSPAKKVYVCNVATQPGETDHFGAADHIRTIADHLGPGVLDCALVNSNTTPAAAIKPEWRVDPVTFEGWRQNEAEVPVVARDVVDDNNPLRHDPDKLAAVLLDLAGGLASAPAPPVRLTTPLVLDTPLAAAPAAKEQHV